MKSAIEIEPSVTDTDYLLSSEFVHPLTIARELGLSRRRLDELHSLGAGPPRIRIGRRVYYSRKSVREWLMQKEERQRRR
jgi:predicted DNA-binding transcriptional regulator AlpA